MEAGGRGAKTESSNGRGSKIDRSIRIIQKIIVFFAKLALKRFIITLVPES